MEVLNVRGVIGVLFMVVSFVACNNEKGLFKKFGQGSISLNELTVQWVDGEDFDPNSMYRYFERELSQNPSSKNISYFLDYCEKNQQAFSPIQNEYFLIIKSAHFLFNEKLDSALLNCNRRDPATFKALGVRMQLWSMVIEANAHYLKGEKDIAKKHYLDAYKKALEVDENPFIELLCVNLGAIEYENGDFKRSVFFLRKAYQLNKSNPEVNPILLSNLASSLLDEHESKEAVSILEEAGAKEIKQPTNYQEYLILINYLNALQQFGDYHHSQQIFNTLNETTIPEVLRVYFYSLAFKQFEQNEWVGIMNFTQRNLYAIQKDFKPIFFRAPITMYQMSKEFPVLFKRLCFKGLPEIKSSNLLDASPKERYYLISSLQNVGFLLNQEFKEIKQASMFEALNALPTASSGVKDILDYENKLSEKAKRLKEEKAKRRENSILALGFGTGLLSIVILLIYVRKLSQEKLKVARLELEAAEKDKERLIENEKLNSRITALSAMHLEKTKDIVRIIDSAPNSKDKTLVRVKKELNSIYMSDKAVNTAIPQTENIQKYRWIWEKYPTLKSLSKTSKNVLILSAEGLGPKDISTTLCLNYSYVRNVRSRLKRELSKINIESFEGVIAGINQKST